MHEEKREFRDYLQILIKRKWWFLLPFLSVLSLALIFVLLLPKVYRSGATILVRKRGSDPVKDILGSSPAMTKNHFNTIRAVVSSHSRIKEILKKIGVDTKNLDPLKLSGIINRIKRGLRILRQGTNIFYISFRSVDPNEAMQIVNAVCGFFVEEEAKTLYKSSDRSYMLLNELVEYYEKRVSEARTMLTKFRIENKGQMPASLDVNFAKLEQSQIKQAKLELKLKEAYIKKQNIKKQLLDGANISLEAILNQAELSPLEEDLKRVLSGLEDLLVLYTEKHPLVVKSRAEIETVKRKLVESYKTEGIGSSVEEEVNVQKVQLSPVYMRLRKQQEKNEQTIRALKAQKETVETEIANHELKLENIPQSEKEFAMLQRDFNVNQNIYQNLLDRLEGARVEKEFDLMEKGYKFELISPAELPQQPISPNSAKNMIVGSLLGFLIGVTLAFWAEHSDHSLRDVKDAQTALKLPVLAAVPTVLTEVEVIRRNRLNMFVFVVGGFYVIFLGLLIIREVLFTYAPQLMFIKTYKDVVYRLMDLVGMI